MRACWWRRAESVALGTWTDKLSDRSAARAHSVHHSTSSLSPHHRVVYQGACMISMVKRAGTDYMSERIVRPTWIPLSHPGLRLRHSSFILRFRSTFREMGCGTAWCVGSYLLTCYMEHLQIFIGGMMGSVFSYVDQIAVWHAQLRLNPLLQHPTIHRLADNRLPV